MFLKSEIQDLWFFGVGPASSLHATMPRWTLRTRDILRCSDIRVDPLSHRVIDIDTVVDGYSSCFVRCKKVCRIRRPKECVAFRLRTTKPIGCRFERAANPGDVRQQRQSPANRIDEQVKWRKEIRQQDRKSVV